MQKQITAIVVAAYTSGLNVALSTYDQPIVELIDASRVALVKLGFNDDDALSILVRSLRIGVEGGIA